MAFYVGCSTYSVMQSYRTVVVLDSFKMAYRDEDSILDQIYEK